MSSQAGSPSGSSRPAANGAPARARYAVDDYPALLWRERRVMLTVFLIVFLIGAAVSLGLKKLYTAHSSVLVRLGQEYVYDPLAGDAGRGTAPPTQQVLESERDILGSDALKRQVIDDIGYGRLRPAAAADFGRADADRKSRMVDEAITTMRNRLKIDTAPDTPVIRLAYSDPDAGTSALVLNTLLSDYLVYRRKVLLDPTANALDQQKRSFQQRLDQADAAYQDFLTSNRIGDFDAEKTDLSQLQAQIDQQQYAAAAQLKEREGRLAGLTSGLAKVPSETGLYRDVDNTAAAKLLDLKLQREILLGKYLPGAEPVRSLDIQIAQLQSAIASGRARGEGLQRTGANPVYQTLETEKLQLAAEVAALRQSVTALAQQSRELTERRLRLASLEPKFQTLSRDRDVLQTNVKDFTVKEEQSQATQEISASTNDNIRIIEPASRPTHGASLRRAGLALSLLFAAFAAGCAGLLRVFMRPGLPAPATAARTLELPVLGLAPMKS